MKKINLIIAIATVTLAAVSCKTNTEQKEAEKQEAPKILVTYYSQTSNTKAVAEEIAKKLGADIEEIVAVNPYDGDFNATIVGQRRPGLVNERKVYISRIDAKTNT
ncbi:MAG: hypothetical protein IIT61_01785, partial [Bacteroidales bacterium]|nr:hypothetical protein [Bacteroidales bacterium]